MGKAAERRKAGRSRYLQSLAESAPDIFAWKWECRVDSWLREIDRSLIERKRNGAATGRRIFTIVDSAMEALAACGPEAWEKYASWTYGVLIHACTARVATLVDSRLYRLSNRASFEHYRKAREHEESRNKQAGSY
ncbi:MAG: hypothetical protein AB2L22_12910 [Syntrophales bacterium]